MPNFAVAFSLAQRRKLLKNASLAQLARARDL